MDYMFVFALLAIICIRQGQCFYETKLAHQLVVASNIAFSSASQINNWSCKQCEQLDMKETVAFANTILNTSGYCGFLQSQNAIIVVFRDTVNIQNWIETLEFTEEPYTRCRGCWVHSGIYTQFQGISALMRIAVQNLHNIHPSAKIYFTGFGVGGALATLASLDIKDNIKQADLLMTFGQPRVGNQPFANFVTQEIPVRWRVICYGDIVPQVPPRLPLPYSHFSSEIWYDQTMQRYKICGAEDLTCSNSLFPWQHSTNDHSPSKYEKLKQDTFQQGNLKIE